MVSVLFYLMTGLGWAAVTAVTSPARTLSHSHQVTAHTCPTPTQTLDTFLATPEGQTFMNRNKLLSLNCLSALVMSTHYPLHYLSVPPGRSLPSDTQWAGRCCPVPPCQQLDRPTTAAQVASVHHLSCSPSLLCYLVSVRLGLQTIHQFSQSQRRALTTCALKPLCWHPNLMSTYQGLMPV